MISHLYPTSSPELNLNLKSSRVVDPRISCTRSTTATYVDPVSKLIKTAAANEVRVEKGGLLVEESRTNECKWSEDVTPRFLAWAVNEATVTANATTAPDGTNTADAVFETTANSDHRLEHALNFVTTISTSVFVKPNGRDYVSLRTLASGAQWSTVVFELTGDGAITKIENGSTNLIVHIDSSIEAVANGWYRISITTSRTAAAYTYPILLGTCTTANPTLDTTLGAELFAGDATKGIYVWGAQFEHEKDFPTSYIPTSGSTVTRAVDLVTFSNNNFTDWFNNSEGTWMLDVDVLGSDHDYPRLLQTNQFANFEYQTLNSAPSAAALAFQGWLTGQSTKTPYGIAPLGEFKVAANYSIGNTSPIYIDGTEQVRGIGYTPGTSQATAPTELRLFRQNNGGQFLSGVVRSMRYYSTSVPNESLKSLTQ